MTFKALPAALPVTLSPDAAPGPYICGQGAGAVTDGVRYGLPRMSFNGCELIAVCNALTALGLAWDLDTLRRWFIKSGGLICLGIFGTRISALHCFFLRCGLKLREHLDPAAFDAALRRGEVGVFSFWWGENSLWVHTVTLRYSGGEVRCYNYAPGFGAAPAVFKSVSDMISRGTLSPIAMLSLRRFEPPCKSAQGVLSYSI